MQMYLLFFSTVILLAFSPGPNVILMINNGLKFPIRDSIYAIPGIIIALLFFASISIFCVQGIFSFSVVFFNIFKIIGAIYLIYLGLKSIFSIKVKLKFKNNTSDLLPTKSRFFNEAFLCCITNPKVLFIYISLIPNFIIPSNNVLMQNIVLCLIQICATFISMIIYLIIAGRAARYFSKNLNLISFCSGILMIIFALYFLSNN